MQIWVERLADRSNRDDGVLRQNVIELPGNHLHSLHQLADVAAVSRRFQCAVQVVEGRQQVSRQWQRGKTTFLLTLLLHPAPVVLEIRDGQQPFLLQSVALSTHDLQLVSVRCELWGGCAWINLDDDAPALRDCMEPFASIYDAWRVESLRVDWWQSCRLPVNWKLATAAFMEGYHVPQTHPQLLPSAQTGAPSAPVHPVVASSLYFMRTLGEGMGGMTHENDIRIAEGLQGIELPDDPGEAMAAWRTALNDAVVAWHRARGSTIPELNDLVRRGITDAIGFCFPHHFILPTYSSASSYRIRPLGPEETLFEIWSLTRLPSDLSASKPQPPQPMAPDDPRWPPIPAQDFSNLPRQQKGLRSKGFEYMRLSDQIEGLISNFERVVDGFLAGLPYGALVPAIQQTNTTIDVPVADLGFGAEAP